MTKRRQWMDDLKLQQDEVNLNKENKKAKVEVLSEIIFKDGKKVRSFRRSSEGTSSNYYLPEHTSFSPPISRRQEVAVIGDVRKLTPTFRNPKKYLSETKKLVDNISSPPENSQSAGMAADDVDGINLERIAQIIQPISPKSDLVETLPDISSTDAIKNVSTEKYYDVEVTVESNHSNITESPGVPEINNYNVIDSFETAVDAVNENNNILDTKDNPILEIHACSGATKTDSEINNIASKDQICAVEVVANCKTNVKLNPNDPAINIAVELVENPSDDYVSPNFPEELVEGNSGYTEKKNSTAQVENDPIVNKKPETSNESQIRDRKCKKKINFDKIYLDFIDQEDADTLLLNEAFPSEDSSWSGDVSSDESSSKGKKKQCKLTQKKKKKQKKSKTLKIATEEQNKTEGVLTQKPKNKKKISRDNQRKRNSGQSYTNKKGEQVVAKTMKPNPCINIDCKRKCGEITEERRKGLFNYFWNLSSAQRQKDWISQCAIKKQIKTHTTDKGESSRRNVTYAYYINEGDGRRQVCQKFLINTIDITQRFLLYTLDNAVEGFAKSDGRKLNGGTNKTTEDVLSHAKTFLASLPLVPSHYCRKDSSRLYLPEEFKNISNLYRIYASNCDTNNIKSMSFKVFSNWFKANYNIGFHIPKKDKCMTCMARSFDVRNEQEIIKMEQHLQEKEESYKRFKCHQDLNGIDPSVICASFDMQKVLNTPYGDNMALYYSRKIAVYNLTIYESKTQAGFCNLWTESDAHRGANEIATCLYNFIQEVDARESIQKVLLYSDSCFGQNKNKTILAMLRYILSKCQNVNTIQMNYLIPGHTYMPVDSMHATIERAVKKTTIWAPSAWPTVIQMARKNPGPYKVTVLEGHDFLGFEDILNKTFKKNQKNFQISKLCIATFRKSHPNIMFIKNSMLPNAETVEINLCSLNDAQPKVCLYPEKLPVSIQKYNDLKKLVDKLIIPRVHAHEYLGLKRDKKTQDILIDTDEEE